MKHVKTKNTKDDLMAQANGFHTPLLSKVVRSLNHRKSRLAYQNFLGMADVYTLLGQERKAVR